MSLQKDDAADRAGEHRETPPGDPSGSADTAESAPARALQPPLPPLAVIIDEFNEAFPEAAVDSAGAILRRLGPRMRVPTDPPRLATEQPPAVRIRQIIKALKHQRERRDLTIEQVAEASGVHKSVISRFENNSADPHLSTILRYADAIGVDFTVLLDGSAVLHYDEQVLSQMMTETQTAKNEAYRELIFDYLEKHANELSRTFPAAGPNSPAAAARAADIHNPTMGDDY